MAKYRIVEEGPSCFYAYKKGLLFWKCLNPMFWDHHESVSHAEAIRLIEIDQKYPKVQYL